MLFLVSHPPSHGKLNSMTCCANLLWQRRTLKYSFSVTYRGKVAHKKRVRFPHEVTANLKLLAGKFTIFKARWPLQFLAHPAKVNHFFSRFFSNYYQLGERTTEKRLDSANSLALQDFCSLFFNKVGAGHSHCLSSKFFLE